MSVGIASVALIVLIAIWASGQSRAPDKSRSPRTERVETEPADGSAGVVEEKPEPARTAAANSMRGRVYTPTGQPHGGAAVYVVYRKDRWPELGGERETPPTVRSDSAGHFTVTELKNEPTWFIAHADGFCAGDYIRIDPEDRHRGVNLVLRRGGVVTGVVRSAVEAVEGRKIQLYSHNGGLGWRNVTTDRQGRFRIDHVIPQKYILELRDDWNGLEYRVPITVREGETLRKSIGVRSKPIRIDGKLHRAGLPVSWMGIQVKRIGSGTGWGNFFTDEKGAFSVDVPEAGVYRFQLGSDRAPSTSLYRRVEDRDVVDLRIELGSGTIHGSIGYEKHHEKYRPVSLVRVTGATTAFDPCSDYWETYAVRGQFKFEGLPAGRYEIRAPDRLLSFDGDPDRRDPVEHEVIELEDGETASISVRRAALGTVYGQVEQRPGDSAEGATVELVDGDGANMKPTAETKVDARGRFEVRGLHPGKYRIVLRHEQFSYESKTVSVSASARSWVRVYLR